MDFLDMSETLGVEPICIILLQR